MSKPVVAVVGRPNVGKSTLFNALAGERISIVKDTPGVTRDRIYADVNWLDYHFTMIDTGGIEPDSRDVILSQMREQAEIAIATADVIIFLTDVRQGLQDSDSKVADMLRRSGKPVVLVVNKVDSFEKFMPDVYEFYNLGIGDPFPISAASMLGLGDMLDEVVKHFPDYAKDEEEDERPKVAIIGKPNVGKSSLINKLAQEDRVIVSDIAGTTRDAIDTDITYDGKEYVFIDTAGLRRKNKIKEEIERYSIIRAVTAVERADVCIIVIDATEGVTEQELLTYALALEQKSEHPLARAVLDRAAGLTAPEVSDFQALPGSGETIMTQLWPGNENMKIWAEDCADFEKLMDYIKAVRTMRTEMNVHPAKKTSMIIETSDPAPFQSAEVYLAKFAFATDVTFTEKYEGSTDGMVQVSTHAARGFIPMMELIDRDKELARLNKEKAKAEKELAMFENQLNNPKFVERAPAALVEDIRNKHAKSQDKLANIEQSIKALD